MRNPVQCDDPIFPLTRKYYDCNFTVEGLENKDSQTDKTLVELHEDMHPPVDEDMLAGQAEPHSFDRAPEGTSYKYDRSGRRLQADPQGTWIRRSKNWRPHEVPMEMWKRSPDLHDMWREMFPDPRKTPIETNTHESEDGKGASSGGLRTAGDTSIVPPTEDVQADGIEDAEGGIAEGGFAGELFETRPLPNAIKNYWQETTDAWVYHKARPSRTVIKPYLRGGGTEGGPPPAVLQGSRVTEAQFLDGSRETVCDWYDLKYSYLPAQKHAVERINSERWTGPTTFAKNTPSKTLVAGEPRIAATGRGATTPKTIKKQRSRITINKVKAELEAKHNDNTVLMSDGLVQPCLQESEQWPKMYAKLERERSTLEEIASFEKQVTRRLNFTRAHGHVARSDLDEPCDLEGLKAHTETPRILSDADIDDDQYFGRSKQFRHRQKKHYKLLTSTQFGFV